MERGEEGAVFDVRRQECGVVEFEDERKDGEEKGEMRVVVKSVSEFSL